MGIWDSLFGGLPRRRKQAPYQANAKRRGKWENWVRARCQPVYIGSGTVLATVLGRLKMYLDGTDMSLAAHLMKDGYWEVWVTEALESMLEPDMIAVDVGANHGYFTLIMALRCERGQVHAFEPNPRLYELLNRNVLVNGFGPRATCHHEPLSGSNDREFHFVVDRTMSGGGHIVEADAVQGREALSVHTRRLDGVPGACDANIVKIDAEGSELEVWRGMSGMIARDRLKIVFIEFAAARYPDPARCLEELCAAGFMMSAIDPERGIISVTPQEILRDPQAEWMLVLRR